jgi:hypothetical protein
MFAQSPPRVRHAAQARCRWLGDLQLLPALLLGTIVLLPCLPALMRIEPLRRAEATHNVAVERGGGCRKKEDKNKAERVTSTGVLDSRGKSCNTHLQPYHPLHRFRWDAQLQTQ